MKTSELIELIKGDDITTNIYRFSAPMDSEYPIITINQATSETNQDLNGNITNEFITYVVSSFSTLATEAENTSEAVRAKLLTLDGDIGDYKVQGFNITNRRTADYFDADLNQVIYNNQFDFIVRVK